MNVFRATVVLAFALVACDGEQGAETTTDLAPGTTAAAEVSTSSVERDAANGGGCADIVDVQVEATGSAYTFVVTVSSADTGWDKYADAWEIRGPGGEVLGTRELAHPHENEQPFTRSLSGVEIQSEVTEVEVAARDSVEGFCGDTMTVSIAG